MRKLKLIWEFRGPGAVKTAAHHEIHLKEYVANQTAEVFKVGCETKHELHAISFIVVGEKDMRLFRDALKPHRGEWIDVL